MQRRSAARWAIAAAGLVSLGSASALAAGPQTPPAAPEDERFDSGAFLNGLRQRGLVDLLALYLKEHPPKNPESRLLLDREVQRAKFADRSLSRQERLAALREANAILERLIADKPKDRRRLEWQADLVYSLVFEEAEPAQTSVLYHGGGDADRKALLDITDRALTRLDELKSQISQEFDRIDALPLAEYEKLEQSGHVERLEQVTAPKADYTWLWAAYANALARAPEDPVRQQRLTGLLSAIAAHPEWTVPGAPFEPQMLLLSGMASRLAGDFSAAEDHLLRAAMAADKLPDDRRAALAWVAFLARIERARAWADGGRFDDAILALDQLRASAPPEPAAPGGASLVTALCERWICGQRARRELAAGRQTQAQQSRSAGAAAILKLFKSQPETKDRLYAILYDQLGPEAQPDALDAVEKAALVAGLLGDADRARRRADATDAIVRKHDLQQQSQTLLQRAVELGERFADSLEGPGRDLAPEILFNAAVAAHRLGHSGRAVLAFLKAGRDFPAFAESGRALVLAAQIGSDLYRDAPPAQRDAALAVYLEVLEALVQRDPKDAAAVYWRFFYAQALEEANRPAQAAEQYFRVDPAHAHALDAQFLRARCLAAALSVAPPQDAVEVNRRVNEINDALREFTGRARTALTSEENAERAGRLRVLLTEAALIPAELCLLVAVNQPQEGLSRLEALEREGGLPEALRPRALRVKLLACAHTGRLDEVDRLLPAYVQADPAQVGATLQKIIVALRGDLDPVTAPQASEDQQRKARILRSVARELMKWAQGRPDVSGADRTSVQLQYGEGLLLTGEYAAAQELFMACGGGTPIAADGGAHARARLGLAEALFGLADFASALPLFNELARPGTLPETEPAHWRALLRDLQCRVALQADPRDILKVIENHRATAPSLGGPPFAAEFEKLRRECQRRLQEQPGPE